MGRRLEAFKGRKGKRRDRIGLLCVIHRLRAEQVAMKEKLKAVTLDPWGELQWVSVD